MQLSSQLHKILKYLLPESNDTDLFFATKNLVKMAVDLKIVMTEERVLFRLVWADGGEDYKEEFTEVERGHAVSETVLLCLFPGLIASKAVDNDFLSMDTTLIKAKVATTRRL